MTLLRSLLQRQLVPSPSRRAFPVDFALESFCCHKDDEHFVQRRQADVPPFACRFSKTTRGGHMLSVADEDGWVQILDTRKNGKQSIIKEWNAHENAVFDIAWMQGEQRLITASGDQTLRLWDVTHSDCLTLFKGHSCSVKSVDFRNDDKFVFATGARDGNVMVWDIRCNRRSGHYNEPVNVISNAHTENTPGTPQIIKKKTRRSSSTKAASTTGQHSVTSVLFQGGEKLISSGAMDGQIKIWDLRKTYTNLKQDPVPFHMFPYPGQGVRKHGFSSLVLDSTHSSLFASCTNDNIYMYSCSTFGQEPIGVFSGHLNSTFYVKAALSPDDMYLLSGSSDNNAYIWRVSDSGAAPIVMTGHLGEVTSVAWCSLDQGKVVTCSDDNSFRIWRIDFQANRDKNLSFVGGSFRTKSSDSSPPISDKVTTSQQQKRTSHSSPSQNSTAVKRLWTPPAKLITNPRLHPLSCHIAMVTRSPQGINRTPPKMQDTLLTSPTISKASMFKPGSSTQVCLNKNNTPPLSQPSASLPLPLKNPVPQGLCRSPKTSSVPRFESPTHLMTSWLRTNSRKRTHSGRDHGTHNLDHTINFEEQSELMLKGKKEETDRKEQDESVDPLHNNKRQRLETNKQENNNYFIGQNDEVTSPLRVCTNDPSHLTTSICQVHKISLGKENQLAVKKAEENGSKKTTQELLTSSQVLPQTDKEQSNKDKARQEENFQSIVKENKRKRSEIIKIEKDITEDCLLSSGTQQTAQQVHMREDVRSEQSILAFFKRKVHLKKLQVLQ